jgi:hypothetical protein
MNSTMEGLWHGVPLAFFPLRGASGMGARARRPLGGFESEAVRTSYIG